MSGPGLNLPPTDPRAPALRLVRAPAFLLLCVGVLAILFSIAGLLLAIFQIPSPLAMAMAPPGEPPATLAVDLPLVLQTGVGIMCGVLSAWGALSAMRLRGYGLAIVGSITAIFCFSPTVCIGIPATCWMLFTLSRPEVRKAFAP